MNDSRLPPRQQWTNKFPIVGERKPTPEAITLDNWQLRFSGEIHEKKTWSYSDILNLPQVDFQTDIHCVTRWSKKDCTWTGVWLDTLFNEVQLTEQARFIQFIAYSERDHSTSLPIDKSINNQVFLAHSLNGQPLEIEHGYPLRTIVPAYYFYKSLKWLKEIRCLAQDELGFWEKGGYHNEGNYHKEQRYITGNLTAKQIQHLCEKKDFRRYQKEILLSLNLDHQDFSGCSFYGVSLKNSSLKHCNLTSANLEQVNFSNSDLSFASLQNAKCDGADFDGVSFIGADLRNCSMKGCYLNAAQFFLAGQEPPQVEGLNLEGAYIEGLVEEQIEFLKNKKIL